MKFDSFHHFDISVTKMLALATVVSGGVTAASGEAMGDVLGAGKPVTLGIVALTVFYIVASAPRRILDRQKMAQARESVLLLAAAKACLGVTGSRARTILLLRSRDEVVADSLRDSARMILLGVRAERAAEEASKALASYSAVSALKNAASPYTSTLDLDDDETRGLTASSTLSEETKLPMFTTACFFAPIMLILYAIFSHSYGPASLAELVAFEFVALDLAFYLASGQGDHNER